MITYTIKRTLFTVDSEGVQDRVTYVLWDASSEDGTVIGWIRNRGTPIPSDYTPADKPYADITEADCAAWVSDLEDEASIQSQLNAVIAELKNPTVGAGSPWQAAFPLWAVGVAYAVGDIVIYDNIGYEVVQAHTSQSTWAPPETPALWKNYVPPSEGPQPWVQPTGSQDAYALGDQVTHVGKLWTSEIDANVFEPGVSSWTDEGVFP